MKNTLESRDLQKHTLDSRVTDGIASYFLKIALPVISESLCDIFNLSIATGCFPDSWKIARVAPIFKSGQTNDRSNYRPISVLPVLARVFENLSLTSCTFIWTKTNIYFQTNLASEPFILLSLAFLTTQMTGM